MNKFFAQAGSLLNHEIREEGVFPRKRVIVRFTYERGSAEFDGSAWTFQLDAIPA